MKKLTDHPKAVGTYPEYNGKVVADLTHKIFVFKSDPDGDCQCGYNHYDAQWPPHHTPADIFKQPEYNMQILHFTEAEWDSVVLFVGHGSLIFLSTQITRIVVKKHEPVASPSFPLQKRGRPGIGFYFNICN